MLEAHVAHPGCHALYRGERLLADVADGSSHGVCGVDGVDGGVPHLHTSWPFNFYFPLPYIKKDNKRDWLSPLFFCFCLMVLFSFVFLLVCALRHQPPLPPPQVQAQARPS